MSFQSEIQNEFSPNIIKTFSDEDLLCKLFLTDNMSTESLCYKVEYDKRSQIMFGTISTNSSYKYKFFRNANGQWYTGTKENPKMLSHEEAIILGRKIRDALVEACQLVRDSQFNSLDDYELFGKSLNAKIGRYAHYGWLKKYLYIMFPYLFVGWYAESMIKHMLLGLGILPEADEYRMIGQLAMIKRLTDDMTPLFEKICFDMFGMMKRFYTIQTYYGGEHYANQWKDHGIVGILSDHIGNLRKYVKNEHIDKKMLKQALNSGSDRENERQAKALKYFYEVRNMSIFVALDGLKPLAFVDHIGHYEYLPFHGDLHFKRGTWHELFVVGDQWCNEMSSCALITDERTLLFLYKRYYHRTSADQRNSHEIKYNTGYQSYFYRNRIIYGAPGTGKSFRLERDVHQLVGEDVKAHCETIEFYPDYSYAQFVGTYKPIPNEATENQAITYKFVPGPFTELYIKAIKNGRSEHVEPYVLVIDEMNRTDAASVFGNFMRLLDRDRNGTGKYDVYIPIDLRMYLTDELGGQMEDYETMRLPDNMFIWASVNLSDQGAQYMDAAFKRRWHFEHIGIDDNDELLEGKYVILGDERVWKVEWNKLRKAINNFLMNLNVNEDKLIGPYFISEEIIVPKQGNEIDRVAFINEFKDKVMMYLFEDAARQKRSLLFECENVYSLSTICKKFEQRGIEVFNKEIQENADALLISQLSIEGSGEPR